MWVLCKPVATLLCIPYKALLCSYRGRIATAVRTEFATVFFRNDAEEMMSPRKTPWDQLLTLEGGTGKQHQTCKPESSFNLFQTTLNLLLRGEGVSQGLAYASD